MKRGKLIVIAGTDGSGKETQTKMLVNRLNEEGMKTDSISFPRYDSPTGKIVGELYLGKELGLGCGSIFGDADSLDAKLASSFYAQDRFAAKPDMEEVLNSGIHLVSDRYIRRIWGIREERLEMKMSVRECMNG